MTNIGIRNYVNSDRSTEGKCGYIGVTKLQSKISW